MKKNVYGKQNLFFIALQNFSSFISYVIVSLCVWSVLFLLLILC